MFDAATARLLSGLLDAKAAAGQAFTVEEARADLALRPGDSQRERAARWGGGWTRRQVRNLMETGTAAPDHRRTSADHDRPSADQKSALAAPQTQEADHDRPSADQGRPSPTPLIKSSPRPLKGAAPQGAESAGFPSGIEGRIALLQAEAERNAAAAEQARAEREAAEAERKRLRAEQRSKRTSFAPPTQAEAEAEIRRYAKQKGRSDWLTHAAALAEEFVGHFTANGWVQGKGRHPVKDWHSAAQGWCRRSDEFGIPGVTPNGAKPGAAAPTGFLGDPRSEMTAAEAEALAARHGLARDDFYRAGSNWKDEPLWKAKIERLIAVGAIEPSEVSA